MLIKKKKRYESKVKLCKKKKDKNKMKKPQINEYLWLKFQSPL
ncbi:MAG: hypothetical protein RLZZ546_795 [Bacteroidota bacterium]|jgi:hypothetical protein